MRQVYPNELYHFGIKGQKWGVRRFQNPDGSLTAAGKERYGSLSTKEAKKAIKKDIKRTMKESFETGKNATIYRYASDYAEQRASKYEKKLHNALENDPDMIKASTDKKILKSQAANLSKEAIQERYDAFLKESNKQMDQLIKEYGESNVNKIKYKTITDKKTGETKQVINERVISAQDIIKSTALTMVGIAAAFAGSPLLFYATPTGARNRANQIERVTYDATYRDLKNSQKVGK